MASWFLRRRSLAVAVPLLMALAAGALVMWFGHRQEGQPDRQPPTQNAGPHGSAAPDEAAREGAEAFARIEAAIGVDGYSTRLDWELAWKESYVLMAYIAMYEGTRDPACLQRLSEHTDRVLANRDDRLGLEDELRGRAMPSWSTVKYSNGSRYAWVAHAGMIVHPIARFVYLVRRDSGLRERFGAKADAYWPQLEACLAGFDADWRDGPGPDEGAYFEPYLDRAAPLNMQCAIGRALVSMSLAGGGAPYRRRAERLARYLRNRLRRDGPRFVWSYWGDDGRADDISHGATSADFAFICHRAGIVFDRADMEAFVQTFLAIAAQAEGFSVRFDGSGGVNQTHSVQAGRWLHLAFFDPRLRTICRRWYRDKWVPLEFTGLLTAAYLVETGGQLEMDTALPPQTRNPDRAAP